MPASSLRTSLSRHVDFGHGGASHRGLPATPRDRLGGRLHRNPIALSNSPDTAWAAAAAAERTTFTISLTGAGAGERSGAPEGVPRARRPPAAARSDHGRPFGTESASGLGRSANSHRSGLNARHREHRPHSGGMCSTDRSCSTGVEVGCPSRTVQRNLAARRRRIARCSIPTRWVQPQAPAGLCIVWRSHHDLFSMVTPGGCRGGNPVGAGVWPSVQASSSCTVVRVRSG